MKKDNKEFFVGYLDMPTGLREFYKTLVPILLLIAMGVGIWISQGAESTGPGTWNTDSPTSYEGILAVDPYPVLHVQDDKVPAGERAVYIVGEGKYSDISISKAFEGDAVKITGSLIKRGHWEMLEIADETSIQKIDQPIVRPATNIESLGLVSIKGEIVDSKCFLGVMKPGEGKVHKACAGLCLLGGMPPILVARNASGERAGYLLVGEDYSSMSTAVVPLVAAPVEVTGELERRGDQLLLKVSRDKLHMLSETELASYEPVFMAHEIIDANYCIAPMPENG